MDRDAVRRRVDGYEWAALRHTLRGYDRELVDSTLADLARELD